MKKLWVALLVVAVAGSFTAAAAIRPAESINDTCPLSGEKIDAKKTSEVKVGFCCGNCKGKFDKEPAKFLGKVKAAEKK